MRPEDVHPEYEQPEPGNIDEWTDDQLDTYRELKHGEHASEARQRQAELSREQQESLAVLESATRDEETYATVDLGDDVSLTVRTKLPGDVEMRLQTIAEAENVVAVKDRILDVLVGGETTQGLIVDDSESDKGYGYTDRAVWEAYYARNGSEALMDVFNRVTEPAIERREELQFRGGE